MNRKKFTIEHEAKLLDAQAGEVDRASAIDCMVSDGLRVHEALVVSMLDDASEYLRSSSLKAAIRWDTPGYLSLLLDRLQNDPSEWVRGKAAVTATWVGMTQPKFRDQLLGVLAHVIDHDPVNLVSCQAYESFVTMATDGERMPRLDEEMFDRKRDVDEKLLAPHRKQAAQKTSAS